MKISRGLTYSIVSIAMLMGLIFPILSRLVPSVWIALIVIALILAIIGVVFDRLGGLGERSRGSSIVAWGMLTDYLVIVILFLVSFLAEDMHSIRIIGLVTLICKIILTIVVIIGGFIIPTKSRKFGISKNVVFGFYIFKIISPLIAIAVRDIGVHMYMSIATFVMVGIALGFACYYYIVCEKLADKEIGTDIVKEDREMYI